MTKTIDISLAYGAAREMARLAARGDYSANRTQHINDIDGWIGRWEECKGMPPRMVWPADIATIAEVPSRMPTAAGK